MKRIMMLFVVLGALVDVGLVTRDASAIVGRPLTPVSYAGVARRTTRRAVAVGAAAAPVAPAPVVVAPAPVARAPVYVAAPVVAYW